MDTLIAQQHIDLFIQTVSEARNIVIVPHVNPDGDAIGSSIGLQRILNNMGKQAQVIIPNNFPDFLNWLSGSEEVIDFDQSPDAATGKIAAADTLCVLDFNDFERSEGLTKLLAGFKGKTILMDHHPHPKAQCDVMLSYPEISSTCELLFRVCHRAAYLENIDVDAAAAIFTGMMTDTGNFSYNASSPETYRIIAHLLEIGIDKDAIHSNVYHTFSEDRWRLIGHSLKDKMVIIPEYRTGYISLTKSELESFNFQPGDTEGLVNYPLQVKGIVFCVFFMEKDDVVKVSLRSKGSFSVNEFSRSHFNGGGHNNAAGGQTELKIEEAIAKLVSLLPQYKTQLLESI
ncbi:MAG: bifunctional oligoribonuclease/PAP phosphatase NrnA [Prolixibacteraceae bacterium]